MDSLLVHRAALPAGKDEHRCQCGMGRGRARQGKASQAKASQAGEQGPGHHHLSVATDVGLTDLLMEMQMMSLSCQL